MPLTCTPYILPCAKFHILWKAPAIHIFPKSSKRSEASTPNRNRFIYASGESPLLPECRNAKNSELAATASVTWYLLDNDTIRYPRHNTSSAIPCKRYPRKYPIIYKGIIFCEIPSHFTLPVTTHIIYTAENAAAPATSPVIYCLTIPFFTNPRVDSFLLSKTLQYSITIRVSSISAKSITIIIHSGMSDSTDSIFCLSSLPEIIIDI